VDSERVFWEHLPVERAREGWQEREVDMVAFMGRTVELSITTKPGPKGDVVADWAGWGEPRLEAPQAVDYRQMIKSKPWIGMWNEAGISALDFVRAGQTARKAQQYENALTWYWWADRALPGRADPWYYAGLVYEDQERWAKALDAYERGLDLSGFRYVRRSSLSYRSGLIYQLRLEPIDLDAALAAYETALNEDKFSSHLEKADCHYRRGEVLWWQRKNLEEAISEFRQAIELSPKHVSAHVLVGAAIYAYQGDVVAAEAELEQAIALAPRNKWAYYHLGEIYRQESLAAKAQAMYTRALELDPDFAVAQQQLAVLESSQ
jgi:tetratricopeptide (TPR) repeat protein